MPYNNIVSRTNAAALIPEQVAQAIMIDVNEQSAAMALFRNTPLSSNTVRIPVISALPVAYFVNGDTGMKQTTEAAWSNKYLNVEEIAAIVPIPDSVRDDARSQGFDLFGSIRPLLAEAVARALDAAIFFGTNKPAAWPTDVVTAAIAAANARTIGTASAAAGGVAEDINQLFGLVEADGYDVNGMVANRNVRAMLRGARDTSGQKLLDVTNESVEGIRVTYPLRGMWPTGAGAVRLIAGDFTQAVLGVRQDLTYTFLDQAVITDNTNAIIYNLPQQDMTALRVVARFAWQVPNPLNRDEATEVNRYPFGVLRNA